MSLVSLSKVCDITAGQSAPQDSDAFGPEGHPFIRAGSLDALTNGGSENDCEHLTEEKAQQYRMRLFPKDTIVFAKSGMSAKIGRVYRLKTPAYIVSHLAAVTPGEDVDPSYLQRWFERNPPSRLIPNEAYPSIRMSEIGDLKIELPKKSDQKRNADILDKADAIRRKRKQAIHLADEFLRSVFLDMFGNPILNSQKLPTVRIDQLSKVIRGSSPRPKGDSRFYDGPVPRLMVEDLTRDGWFVTPSIDSLTEEGAKLSRPVPKGTLVMVVSGKVGVMARLEVDACIHDGFVALLNIDEEAVLPNYLMFALTFLQQTHAKREAGAIFKNLTTSQIKEMDIPIPSIEQQKKFDEIFFTQRTLLRKLNSIDDECPLMGSLQQIVFRGGL